MSKNTTPMSTEDKKNAKRGFAIIGGIAVVVGAYFAGTGNAPGAETATANTAAPATTTVTKTVTAPAPKPAAAAAEKPAEPAGPSTTMGPGVYEVGSDIAAGQYKTAGPPAGDAMGMCYWARSKDDTGDFNSLITNGTVEGPGSLTVNDGEYLELQGECEWKQS